MVIASQTKTGYRARKPKAIDTSGDPQKLTDSVVDLAKFVDDEFASVATSMQADNAFNINYVAPSKPRIAQLVYADGTHWNPGSGEGFYEYTSAGAWVPLFATAAVPSGSVMLFWQTAAPVGWTINATQNDKALRVVSGTGGVSGGTNSFSSVMAQTATGSHTLSVAEMPSHNHPGSLGELQGQSSPSNLSTVAMLGKNDTATTTAQLLVIASQGGGGGHTHPFTMSIQYIDVILASKN